MVKKIHIPHKSSEGKTVREKITELVPNVVMETDLGTGALTIHTDDDVNETSLLDSLEQEKVKFHGKKKKDHDPIGLTDLTPAELDSYIENSITSLATAKDFIKKLAKIVLLIHNNQTEADT
jgi:hypothetical protein